MQKIKTSSRKILIFFVSIMGSMAASATSKTLDRPAAIFLKSFADQKVEQKYCQVIQESVLLWSSYTQPAAKCFTTPSQLQAEIVKGQVAFSLVVEQNLKRKTVTFSINVLQTDDVTEPQELKWEVDSSKGEDLASIQRIIKNFADYDFRKDEIKKLMLLQGLSESKILSLDMDGLVIEADSGDKLSFTEAYRLFTEENPKHKNYLAAGLQIAAVLGAATINYYIVPDSKNVNNQDWDYRKASSLKARFGNGEAVRFDDNSFATNTGHYYAGLVYYSIARESGLSRFESLLVSAASSSLWEYISEYREVVSIDDQINTTLGGFIIGESMHQMAKIFQSGSDTGVNGVLKKIFNSPSRLSNWTQKKAKGKDTPVLDLESKPDVWARLDLYAGVQKMHNGETGQKLGFKGEVVSIPLFQQPGQVRQLLMKDSVYSQMKVENSVGHGASEFLLFTKTTLAAIYDKKLGKSVDGKLEGYNLFVGPSVSLEIAQTPGQVGVANSEDFRGIVHVFGASADMRAYHKGVEFRAVVDLYGDFAMMRSYAYQAYSAGKDQSKTASVLREQGYYYGLGGTQSVGVQVNSQKWEVGGRVQNTTSAMINSRGRFSESETDETQARDSVLTAPVWVAYRFNRDFRVELGVEKFRRGGAVNGLEISKSDLMKYGKLIYIYR